MSMWARPDALPNWVPLLQIGSSTDTFFLLQSSTQAAGATGFAATFKAPGNPTQERLTLGGGNDLPLNAWTHVVFTMSGSTGKIYFDGELQATRTDFTLGIGDVGVGGSTTANYVGGTSWPDPRFDGLVDDLQMYAYELSAEQVAELFEGPTDPNAAPVGAADAYGTEEDTPLTVEAPGVLTNDTDADGDDLTADRRHPAGERRGQPGRGRILHLHARRRLLRHRHLHLPGRRRDRPVGGDDGDPHRRGGHRAGERRAGGGQRRLHHRRGRAAPAAGTRRAGERHRCRWRRADRHGRQPAPQRDGDTGRRRVVLLHPRRRVHRQGRVHLPGGRRRGHLGPGDRDDHGGGRARRRARWRAWRCPRRTGRPAPSRWRSRPPGPPARWRCSRARPASPRRRSRTAGPRSCWRPRACCPGPTT